MRLILIIIFLFTNSIVSFSQSSNDVIFIGQSAVGGLRNYSSLIGTKKNKILKVEEKLNLKNKLVDEIIVSNKSFSEIRSYILSKCNPVKNLKVNNDNFIIITLYSDTKSQNCYLVEKNQIKPYFSELSKIISSKASNKKDIEQLKELFDRILTVIEYDFSKVRHE